MLLLHNYSVWIALGIHFWKSSQRSFPQVLERTLLSFILPRVCPPGSVHPCAVSAPRYAHGGTKGPTEITTVKSKSSKVAIKKRHNRHLYFKYEKMSVVEILQTDDLESFATFSTPVQSFVQVSLLLHSRKNTFNINLLAKYSWWIFFL